MSAANVTSTLDPAHPATANRKIQILSIRLLVRVGTILGLAGLLVSTFYSASSVAITQKVNKKDLVSRDRMQTSEAFEKIFRGDSRSLREPVKPFLLASPQASDEMVQTYASDCLTPQTVFTVGDTVCVKAPGVPLNDFFPRRLLWACPNSTIVQSADITTDPQTGSLALAATYTIGNSVADSRGTWQVIIGNPFFFFPEAVARFTVVDAANPTADLGVASTSVSDSVQAGSQAVFGFQVNNYGPDSSNNVTLTDAVPDNASFVSFVQVSGPAFSCDNPVSGGPGTSICTIASLASGDSATFIATFDVNTGVATGTAITNTADVASPSSPGPSTPDENTLNDSISATTTVSAGGGGGDCTLNCPEDINAVADTTEGGQRGSHITFDAAEPSGSCGAVTAVPASGSFFPVGTTTVTVTSESGGGSCSFTVTVEDSGTNPPKITCPASIEANAGNNCAAVVTVGTASASGDNVTIIATRSDGKPMYSCDANGTNCIRRSSDDPFPTGVTTITWRAYSHNIAGPYADADDEEAHRTGSALCTQTIAVNDVTPPIITPPANQSAPADATCQFALLDYTTIASVSDNCACASTDASEICDSRRPITITQSPAPGTLVGLGPHTITLMANDGSSNNNGAGNTATSQFTVTVVDTTPPAINCPTDLIVDFNPAVNGAVVTYTPPVGTDNCSGATTVQTAGLASGATFPAGTTTNTFRVTDAAGNTASCSFKVTVAITSIIGLDSVSLSGVGFVDSYDSTGGYPATKGSLANVFSNGTITIAGSAKVFGNVRSTRVGVAMSGTAQVTGNATAGTTVSRTGSATVLGTITNNQLAPVMTLPAVPACGPPYSANSGISGNYSYNSSTGDLSLTSNNIATLANGTYCFHNVTLTNSAQLKVNGPVVIKLTGTLNASGMTSITNTTANPANLQFLSSFSGSNGVILSNGSNEQLMIYAPNTAVTISGATPLFGTAVGKTVTVSNGGVLHYDTGLKTAWPDIWTLIFGP